MKRGFIFALLSFVLLTTQNCGMIGSGSGSSKSLSERYPHSRPSNYFGTSQQVVVEVYYEPGAEPYVGETFSGSPYWGILRGNLNSIFQFRSVRPSLTIPTTLGEMSAIPSQGRTQWSAESILELNERHRAGVSSASVSRFYVYFVNGYLNTGDGPQTQVIGVSITGTPVIAIFKDVVRNSGSSPTDERVARFVEQSTLVHEMGHALGFVNNGVPMAAHHQDVEHGAHSTNEDCVMYWLNEGASDLRQFVLRYITQSNPTLWGAEVLADAEAFSQ